MATAQRVFDFESPPEYVGDAGYCATVRCPECGQMLRISSEGWAGTERCQCGLHWSLEIVAVGEPE